MARHVKINKPNAPDKMILAIENDIKSGAIKLNTRLIDQAIKLMRIVHEHELAGKRLFSMKRYSYSTTGKRVASVTTGTYASRVKKQIECGVIACLAGWLDLCLKEYELLVVSSELDSIKVEALELFLYSLLFSADWENVAPTSEQAILRLVWLKQKGLGYCYLQSQHTTSYHRLWVKICDDLGTKLVFFGPA